jgi:Tfp pilus assembly protein PilF
MAAGRDLGVSAVLTGRLAQRGDDVVVSAELVDVRDNKQIWGQQYTRKVSDLLTVQRDIAQEITSHLRMKLSPAEHSQLMKNYAVNADAYQLYLKGRFHWNKRTRDGVEKSIEYFNQAIEHDPNYALAHAGLADSWFTMGWYRWTPGANAYPKSKAAALKAIQLDPQSAEAHTALAVNKANYEWDWAGAENEFKLALQLNPKYATAYHRYSLFLPILGRMDEAIAAAKKAQELDPLSLIINENVGDVLRLAKRDDEAERQLLKTIELDPNFSVAHHTLARVYDAKGMYEKAIEENWHGAPPEEIARAKRIYAQSGMPGIWRDDLNHILEQAKQGNVRSFTIAGLYSRLGEKDKAFEWLNKALDARQVQFTYLGDRRFDNIRSDPRYTELLKRVGLQK